MSQMKAKDILCLKYLMEKCCCAVEDDEAHAEYTWISPKIDWDARSPTTADWKYMAYTCVVLLIFSLYASWLFRMLRIFPFLTS